MRTDADHALHLFWAPKGSADDTALVEAMHAIKDEFEAYGCGACERL